MRTSKSDDYREVLSLIGHLTDSYSRMPADTSLRRQTRVYVVVLITFLAFVPLILLS